MVESKSNCKFYLNGGCIGRRPNGKSYKVCNFRICLGFVDKNIKG